ncbi:DUF3267 domain-containing protein [Paraclostridium sordellii]|uniref:DUF3267 domain-containing protein n=1 Tax=Paraclostridium sordellii TaxID=1505 RepID=UPI0005E88D43|nr:DUF3267 domain-containing protein [Paeniclostridium sordellii]CEO22942.1 Protein of uncharacterised function (DUF3267) [[Clostridium] sordellii] [Paeniclostridium sordellii]
MKYTKYLPKTDKNLSNQLLTDGWKKIKEPLNLTLATLISIPFMILCSIIFLGLIFYINPDYKNFFKFSDSISFTIKINLKTFLFLVGIYLFTLLHELIHAVFIPNALKSDKVYFGVRLLYGFVYTNEKISKFRFIIVSIMPFIILSIIFPILLNTFGLLNNYILFLCLLNALGSSADFLNIFLILTQVPNKSYLIINGFETYFKN